MKRVVRPPVEREVDEELAFHVEMRVRELVAEGWSEEDARAEALRRFGDIERVKADMRDHGTGRDVRMARRHRFDALGQDLSYALRQLVRAPAFAALTIVTLAVAIGANTAVFSVVNGVLLAPLPYPDPDELVAVWARYLPPSGFDIPKFVISGPEVLDYRESTEALEALAVYRTSSRTLTGDGREADRVRVSLVSEELLPMLAGAPALGRFFTAAEDVPDGPAVTVLSHEVWTSRFGGDPAVLGRTVLMNGTPTEVVGVTPAGLSFPTDVGVYLPLGLARASEGSRGNHNYAAVGRLAEGRTIDDVGAELGVTADRWAATYPHNRGHFLWAVGLEEELVGDARGTLTLLMAAVALVLLVACANVANVQLARGERRRTELAVRTALGAGTARLARQLLTESLTLALLAGLLGLALAHAIIPALVALDPAALPRLGDVQVDAGALSFTLAVTALSALLFGTAPAMLAGRGGRAAAAGPSARPIGSARGSSLRRALVAGEVGLSLVVVILAGLIVRSFDALTSTDPGLEPGDLLTFSVSLPEAGYPSERVPPAFETLLDELRALPGVTSVAAGTNVPFAGSGERWDFQLDDRPPRQPGDPAWHAAIAFVTPRYFETLGMPVVAGRTLAEGDRVGAPLVAVVSETMAETYWPGESAVGKRFGYGGPDGTVPWLTVVGVVGDFYTERVDEEVLPHVFVPVAQASEATRAVRRTMTIAARTGIEPGTVISSVRSAVSSFDSGLALYELQTMEDAVDESLARHRVTANLLGGFALIALLLAAVGSYGVISYSVAGRTREIGVRVALGAERSAVTRMVLDEGTRPVLAGVAIGLPLAWLATRFVESLLYGVAPTDPLTFTALPLAVLVLGVLASWLPARRAMRVAPTEALRAD